MQGQGSGETCFRFCLGPIEDLPGFSVADVVDEDVSPADLAAVRLQHDRPPGAERRPAIPVVLYDGVVDDELVVQPDPGPIADLPDAKPVPLAEGAVRHHQGI